MPRVLKVMTLDVKSEKFKREIKIIKTVQGGPNIVEFHGTVESPKYSSKPAIVMDFVDSRNLTTN